MISPSQQTELIVAEPGYTTTEFWGKLFVQLVSLVILFHLVSFTNDQLQGILGLGGLVIPEIVYAISRGLRKSGTNDPVTQAKDITAVVGKLNKPEPPAPTPIVPTR